MFSFAKRKRQNELEQAVRRIIDRTVQIPTSQDCAPRSEARYNRTLPVLLTPWNGQPLGSVQSAVGLTEDISDRGLAVIVTQRIPDEDLAVTFCLGVGLAETEMTLLGHARHCFEIGGGFWKVGIELIERLDEQEALDHLLPLARKLLPISRQIEPALAE